LHDLGVPLAPVLFVEDIIQFSPPRNIELRPMKLNLSRFSAAH